MQIPCRHIFKFLLLKNLEAFRPHLCAQRWTKAYYYQSHSGIAGPIVPHPQPIHITKVRVPHEKDKFKKAATLTKDINNLVSNMSNSQYEFYVDKIRNLRSELIRELDPQNSAPAQGYSATQTISNPRGNVNQPPHQETFFEAFSENEHNAGESTNQIGPMEKNAHISTIQLPQMFPNGCNNDAESSKARFITQTISNPRDNGNESSRQETFSQEILENQHNFDESFGQMNQMQESTREPTYRELWEMVRNLKNNVEKSQPQQFSSQITPHPPNNSLSN